MQLTRNAFTHAIAAREKQVGLWISLASPFATELLNDGFNFVASGSDTGLLAKASDTLLSSVKGCLS